LEETIKNLLKPFDRFVEHAYKTTHYEGDAIIDRVGRPVDYLDTVIYTSFLDDGRPVLISGTIGTVVTKDKVVVAMPDPVFVKKGFIYEAKAANQVLKVPRHKLDLTALPEMLCIKNLQLDTLNCYKNGSKFSWIT